MTKPIALLALFCFLCVTIIVDGQYTTSKPGSCPTVTGFGSCAIICRSDQQCEGSKKCCYTSCGGTSCRTPIS